MATSRKLPIFVFPEELKFDETNHKQVLTIYNPYDVPLKYKILSNSPFKYKVMEPQGTIQSQCCVDVVICHLPQQKTCSEDQKDKFRIDLYQGTKLIGQKQVHSQLTTHRTEVIRKQEVINSSDFKEFPFSTRTENRNIPITTRGNGQSSPGWLTILIGVLSLFVLLLPLDGESSSWPDWIHVTINMKLIASFVLGLVTMAILGL